MIRRALPPALALALLATLTGCGSGGGDDTAADPTGSTVPAAAPTAAPADTTPVTTAAPTDAATATTAAAPVDMPILAAEPVDPAAADPCTILSLDEVSAAVGEPASEPVNYNEGSDQVAECNWYLAGSAASFGFQIELQLPVGSQTVNEGRPFAAGAGGEISDSAGYPFAITDINGWLVKLTGLSGPISEDQLVALGRLLEQRLVARDASVGGGTPAGPSGNGAGDGTCSVEVTGALTDSYTSGQDIGEAYASAWVPDEEEAVADTYFPGGAPDFQVGCSGDAGSSVLISLFDIDVPLGSASVTVPDNQAGYFSNDGLVGNRGPAEVVLTKFDETGMTGSITFTGDGLGTGESTVTMTFDFTNDWAG
jgi:hypothetical protein